MSDIPDLTFQKLISPLDVERFFGDYFEDKALLTAKSELSLNFNLQRFEELLWSHHFDNSDNIQVNKGGVDHAFDQDKAGKNHFKWLMDQFSDGCTIIFNGIDEIDEQVGKLARSLDVVFGGWTTVNAFLTPAGEKGFLPHFDTHDVFILQLEGTKEWHLYDKPVELPLDKQIYLIDQETLGDASEKHTLKSGNVLYIPRGLVHGSHATNDYSLHITIGIRPVLGIDLLKNSIDMLAEQDVTLRKSVLKSKYALKDLVKTFSSLLEEKSDDSYFNKILDEHIKLGYINQSKPYATGRLSNLVDIERVDAKTRLRSIYNGKDLLVDHEDKIRLYFPGIGMTSKEEVQQGFLEYPAIAYGALTFIRSRNGGFAVEELPDFYPFETKLSLVKSLLKDGYLVLV